MDSFVLAPISGISYINIERIRCCFKKALCTARQELRGVPDKKNSRRSPVKQEEIKERYKRKTGTDLVPERRKMAALRDMFDFQRFSGNEKLCSMIRRAEEHSGSRLSFEDLDFVNAAGTPDMLQKKNRDLQ
jgi:hypothetical protein